MKVKKQLLPAIVLSMITILGSSQIINANTKIEESKTSIISEKHDCDGSCSKCNRQGKMMGKNIFKESIDELQKSGVLTTEDVKKIDTYHEKLREQKREEMKKNRKAIIDNMVNEKVISEEKGNKLKSTIEKNIENKKLKSHFR